MEAPGLVLSSSIANVGSLSGELEETAVIKKNDWIDQVESIKTEMASIKTAIKVEIENEFGNGNGNGNGNTSMISQGVYCSKQSEENTPVDSLGTQLQNIPKIDRGLFHIDCVHCPCSYHLNCAKECSPDQMEDSFENWCCPKCR